MMFVSMANDRKFESLNKKQKTFGQRLIYPVENRFSPKKYNDPSAGTRVNVKQLKLRYSKISGFFEAI
ncbi:hypothetical protein NEIG_00362 [Nematocida sp. ERTm5]|nr:hypothetical protein NEIG_00362 [Nematocida sp. ERTm5]